MYLNQNNKNSITYINLTKNNLTTKSIRTFSLFLENLSCSKNLETLILDGNVKIQNQGLQELSNSLLLRMEVMNSGHGRDLYGLNYQLLIMPLLYLSCSNTGINDAGFIKFIKKLEEIQCQFDPYIPGLSNKQNEKDYYRGGMGINFSHNCISNVAFMDLSKLITNFKGLRSINLSHATGFSSTP